MPTFYQDIEPLIASKCMGCHVSDGVPLNYDGLVWDLQQAQVPDQFKSPLNTAGTYFTLNRPLSSKYINSNLCVNAPLQWYVENQRLDGFTNEQFDLDIDFAGNHPTELTTIEKKLFCAWIDAGAERGIEPEQG